MNNPSNIYPFRLLVLFYSIVFTVVILISVFFVAGNDYSEKPFVQLTGAINPADSLNILHPHASNSEKVELSKHTEGKENQDKSDMGFSIDIKRGLLFILGFTFEKIR